MRATEDRPKADSAQEVYLHTVKELFAMICTEQESWSGQEIFEEAAKRYTAGIVCGDSAALMALASHKLHRCPLRAAR